MWSLLSLSCVGSKILKSGRPIWPCLSARLNSDLKFDLRPLYSDLWPHYRGQFTNFNNILIFCRIFTIKYGRFCHYLTPVNLTELSLSISRTQYNNFYMKISLNERTFSNSSFNSPPLSFKSKKYSSIWIIRNWENVRNWENDCITKCQVSTTLCTHHTNTQMLPWQGLTNRLFKDI